MAYKTASLVASVALLLALADLPYGYYQLLRIVVCGAAAYGAFVAKEQSKETWMWVLGGIAVLFNPLVPIHLDRGLWTVLDLGAAVVILASRRALAVAEKEVGV